MACVVSLCVVPERGRSSAVSESDAVSCCPQNDRYRLLYGYIGLALGFGVTALLIIIFRRTAWVTSTTERNAKARRPKIERVNATEVKEEKL
jgi:hypothetical protein